VQDHVAGVKVRFSARMRGSAVEQLGEQQDSHRNFHVCFMCDSSMDRDEVKQLLIPT
jgi:hypothetical protein